jgi:hypothetical protein
MQRVVFVSLMVFIATSTPVLAAEFWLSQNPDTKKCRVVEIMPDGKETVIVGATSYPTAADARAAKWVALKAGVCVPKKPK